ncbi:MAG: hypothetical protein LAO20_09390 [Acidobacteriia bacterium]|nr:hypothetical protein [Terriglobia bacterium]
MTLRDDDIITERAVTRRSFISRVGAAVVGAASLVIGSEAASALALKDSDTGRPPDNKGKSGSDHDKREPGDAKGSKEKPPKKSHDSDTGRPPDNKAKSGSDHDKREPGDSKS